MEDILWVSIGAVLGANLRYGIARLVGRLVQHDFPFATLAINVTGSLALGVFFMWARHRMDLDLRWRLLIAVGFCGGYTTFSSFAWETLDLFQKGRWGAGLANMALSNLLGMAAVVAGAYIGDALGRRA
jgi:CrcB protein